MACNYDPAATIDDGSCDYTCLGCTDATAINFDSTATVDDGSCCFTNIMTLEMSDTWGDGWNGNVWTVFDASGVAIWSASLPTGYLGTADFCIPDGCDYTITCDGGAYQYEVDWTLIDASGTIIMTGGAPSYGLELDVK